MDESYNAKRKQDTKYKNGRNYSMLNSKVKLVEDQAVTGKEINWRTGHVLLFDLGAGLTGHSVCKNSPHLGYTHFSTGLLFNKKYF